jgi:heavy metal translocating P-type ATPase
VVSPRPAPLPGIASARALLVAVPAAGLLFGLVAVWSGHPDLAGLVWSAFTLPVLSFLLVEIVTSLRRGEVGLDIVAALSMTAALAFGEHLAAVVVALMYAGGQNLETFAERRARREMTALLGRVSRTATRYHDGGIEEVDLDMVRVGDRLLVRQGDAVAVDGEVVAGVAVLDQSALTGESLPVQLRPGQALMSGALNVGAPFDMTALRPAAESTYAGIIRLVEAAQRARSPMARVADRFAMVFLAVAVAIAGMAWFVSGDPIRAVAVLVIATPCPLILAVPVAIVSGLSRAAKQGILIKGGGALEALARIKVLVMDKTGTLTHGRARIVSAHAFADIDPAELLRLAASLDQASKHAIARAVVAEARARGLSLSLPEQAAETPGDGIVGRVDGRSVIVGGIGFVTSRSDGLAAARLRPLAKAGAVVVAVAIDGKVAGALVLVDELRAGVRSLLHTLRQRGIERIVLATGDRGEVAAAVVEGLLIDRVCADLGPEQKVAIVLSEREHGLVMMVGDGVNDAPALAAADVGLAMGVTGAAAAAEVADVVLLVDSLERLLPALDIARRSRSIALQSVLAGIGLSVAGMTAAAFGWLSPVQGAVLQELIDVAVILNALRATTGQETGWGSAARTADQAQFSAETTAGPG